MLREECYPLNSVTAVTAVTVLMTAPTKAVTAVTTDTHLNMMHFTPEEMLSFMSSHGTIDLSRVRNDMIKAEIDNFIENTHTSPITQGPDGRWRTSVYEGKKRRLIAKTSLDDLKLEVYCFYTGILKEDVFREHTIETLYPRWKEYKALHTNAKTSIMRIESVW